MSEKEKDSNYQNDWANDIKGIPIHIENAESGAKGYYCLGCTKEMQAVKYKNPKHQSYFRHHASNIDKENTECVVASRNYRERIAKDILQRLKVIKVPTLLKFPPKGNEGQPMFLDDIKTIVAHKVKSELSFYENVGGEIKWGRNLDIDERYLLIRPDITFFNEKDEPILFIELVVTHKISYEKKAKLSRIGIDTVQIIIPKLPEPEIEKSLKSVRKIKWVYNAIEANTKYISLSKGDTERVFPIDEEQRKLLNESFACTAAKIGNLIRSITRSLDSQSYRNAERLFEQEIQRIETATRRENEELEAMEREEERFVEREFTDSIRGNIERRTRLESTKTRIRDRRSELEGRYIRKKSELIENQYDDNRKQQGIRQAIEQCLEAGTTEGEVRERFREQENGLEEQFRFDEEKISKDFDVENNRIRTRIKEEQRVFERYKLDERELSNESGKHKNTEQIAFSAIKTELERETGDLEEQIKNSGNYIRQRERGLKDEFKKLREQAFERIKQRNSSGGDELAKRIEAVLEVGRISGSYNEKLSTYERYRKGLEIARSGAWKRK